MEQNQLNDKKPCLIQCGQGFCVSYQNRFLYSKYSPDRAIKKLIADLTVHDNTLILIFSPCLWLGLEELEAKLPCGCKLLGVEFDKELYNLARQNNTHNILLADNIEQTAKIAESENFKRVIRIDFSAGTRFNDSKYNLLFDTCQNIIFTKIKNRLTLVNLGRLFSKNIFKNLHSLAESFDLESFYHTISKPILVCAAGESLEDTLTLLNENKSLEDSFYILAVDAALQCLLDADIHADAVTAMESQAAIEKAWIGSACKSRVFMFADLTSRNHIQEIAESKTAFFLSQYASMIFFERLKDNGLLPPVIPALGSVGLAAVWIALALRQSPQVPVYVTGLDFSFSIGKTHARGTHAHKARLKGSSKKHSIDNIEAAFSQGSFETEGINGIKVHTTKNLYSYAQLFKSKFMNTPNLFDARSQGINLGLKSASITAVTSSPTRQSKENPKPFCTREQVHAFLKDEAACLERLKDLLSNGKNSCFFDPKRALEVQIEELLKGREYLYIHFPDGQTPDLSTNFLKRIRIEIDFFLKEINRPL